MRSTIWIAGAWLLFASQVAVHGCGSSDSSVSCDEGGCECRDRDTCDLDCGDIVGCSPSCLSFSSSCFAVCGDDCEFDCQSGDGQCLAQCGENCDAHCGSVESCVAETGPNSTFLCVNTPTCAAEMGDGSMASCLGVDGTCAIRCLGECEVFCNTVGACNVECTSTERQLCGDEYWVCGAECPPEMM